MQSTIFSGIPFKVPIKTWRKLQEQFFSKVEKTWELMNFDYYRSFHRFLAVEGDVSKALGSLCGHDLGDVNIDDTPIAGEMALQNFLGDLCGHTRFHEDSVPLPHHPRRENKKVNKISILQTSETRRTETCSRYCDPPSGRARGRGGLALSQDPVTTFLLLLAICLRPPRIQLALPETSRYRASELPRPRQSSLPSLAALGISSGGFSLRSVAVVLTRAGVCPP